MKFIFNLEGQNSGADFLKKKQGQTIDIESLYKDALKKQPPLSSLTFEDGSQFSLQIIDVRFIDNFIFMYSFVLKENGDGGKALIKLSQCKQ